MTDRDHADDPAERERLSEEDVFLAALVREYGHRRDRGLPPRAHDLLARAAEFGDDATTKLRTVLALYEALVADDVTPRTGHRPVLSRGPRKVSQPARRARRVKGHRRGGSPTGWP